MKRTNTNSAHELFAFVKFDNTLWNKVEAANNGSGNVRLRKEENVNDVVNDGGRKGCVTLKRKDGKLAVDGTVERHGDLKVRRWCGDGAAMVRQWCGSRNFVTR